MKYLTTCLLLLLTTTVYSEVLVPVVKIQTNMGIIIMELYPDKAPKTVENFLRYAKEGFYEGTLFHRVIKNFIVQVGGYTTDYTKKPTYAPIPNESKNGLKNLRGSVAMARNFDDPDSATSQFFINVNNNYSLDYQDLREELGYTVFGQVISGMEVVDKIQAVETGSFGTLRKNVPKVPIIIAKITIEQALPKGIPAQSPTDKNDSLVNDKARESNTNLKKESLEPSATDKKNPINDDEKESIATPISNDNSKIAPNTESEIHNDKVKSAVKPKENGASPESKSSKNLPANKSTQPPDAPSSPDKPDSLSH